MNSRGCSTRLIALWARVGRVMWWGKTASVSRELVGRESSRAQQAREVWGCSPIFGFSTRFRSAFLVQFSIYVG